MRNVVKKKYLIVQVHLTNDCAEDVLTAMLAGWDWEFVSCVAPREDLLVYMFRRDFYHYGGRTKKEESDEQDSEILQEQDNTVEEPGIKPAHSNGYVPAVYKGKRLLTKKGDSIMIPAGVAVKMKESSYVIVLTNGMRFSTITGKDITCKRSYRKKKY